MDSTELEGLFLIKIVYLTTTLKKIDRPTLGTPHCPPDYKISAPELMLCKKTSAITYQKIGPVTPVSDPHPGCVARGAGCVGHKIVQIRLI